MRGERYSVVSTEHFYRIELTQAELNALCFAIRGVWDSPYPCFNDIRQEFINLLEKKEC